MAFPALAGWSTHRGSTTPRRRRASTVTALVAACAPAAAVLAFAAPPPGLRGGTGQVRGASFGPSPRAIARLHEPKVAVRQAPPAIGAPRLRHSLAEVPPKEASPTSAGAGLLASGFALWYAANVSFNIVNKQALDLFPHAWTVSVAQLATVALCSAVGWATGLLPSPQKDMGHGFLWRLLPAAVCHAMGNGLTSMAFSRSSVSFTHVVKTSEPIWMALGNFLVSGTLLPWQEAVALLPVMLGVALASAGELAFTWAGFLAALGSTICFAGRGIFSKRLMSKSQAGRRAMSPLNVYAMDSLLALAFTVPVAVLFDGPSLRSGTLAADLAAHGPEVALLLAATGLSYYAYNAIAFKLLDKLDVVSHAVGNLGKRVFVIGLSALALHTPLTARAALGSAIAVAGSGLYSFVKARNAKAAARQKQVAGPSVAAVAVAPAPPRPSYLEALRGVELSLALRGAMAAAA